MKITLRLDKNGKLYILTYDEYNVLDTIECDGKLLVSTHHVAKRIVVNSDKIIRGSIPKGFTKV